ncbi:MAG: hypothetical protein ACFWTQ_06415 [Lactococcus sp.]
MKLYYEERIKNKNLRAVDLSVERDRKRRGEKRSRKAEAY